MTTEPAPALKPFLCEYCKQVLAQTDGKVLYFNGTVLTAPVALICPKLGCRRKRVWRPLRKKG
jgi:hypothetical protein